MGGVAPDGKYYGSRELGPGEVEWLEPREAPDDPDEEPEDDDRHRFTEPYSGIVGGIDYKNSKRPGSGAYEQGSGALPPIKVSCPGPPSGCGAEVDQPCTFEYAKTEGRKREIIRGERRMACVARQRKADKT